jgi:hypothetical protein
MGRVQSIDDSRYSGTPPALHWNGMSVTLNRYTCPIKQAGLDRCRSCGGSNTPSVAIEICVPSGAAIPQRPGSVPGSGPPRMQLSTANRARRHVRPLEVVVIALLRTCDRSGQQRSLPPANEQGAQRPDAGIDNGRLDGQNLPP